MYMTDRVLCSNTFLYMGISVVSVMDSLALETRVRNLAFKAVTMGGLSLA